jgi:putative N6-adenine-specific DNA methylase
LKGWGAQQKVKPDPAKPATLFVRFADDECTLSLDTSGERLHKRGVRQHIGEAPLRETIAAALLQMVERKGDLGETRDVEVVDPMMGSGTFLLEAADRSEVVAAREFAFASFHHGVLATPRLVARRPAIVSLVGYEIDAKAQAAAQENLQRAGVKGYQVRHEDIFKAAPLPCLAGRQRWVLANPPYGERLKVKEPLAQYYAKLFAAVESTLIPHRACFILPAKAVKGRFDLPRAWKVLEKRSFVNGGIPVVAFLFGRIGG